MGGFKAPFFLSYKWGWGFKKSQKIAKKTTKSSQKLKKRGKKKKN
jgi:hypothetical protein